MHDWGSFWQEWFDLLRKDGSVETGMIICWLLWNNRNTCWHENLCRTPTAIVLAANRIQEDYKSVHCKEQSRPNNEQGQWHPPLEGTIKINTDAGFSESTGEATLGAVARDFMGQLWFCAATKMNGIQSPIQAELLAILYGLKLARENGFQLILVETDSSLAASEITKKSCSFYTWGSTITDIFRISEDCEDCSFNQVKRGSNSFAHNLAKLVESIDDHRFWRELPQTFVIQN